MVRGLEPSDVVSLSIGRSTIRACSGKIVELNAFHFLVYRVVRTPTFKVRLAYKNSGFIRVMGRLVQHPVTMFERRGFMDLKPQLSNGAMAYGGLSRP